MDDELDRFVEDLQERINEETRSAYGDVAFNRWLNPRYMGPMEAPDGYARVTGSCGDTIEIFLKFNGDRVESASFRTDGCGASTVCGSFAAELALGKDPDELLDVTGDTILEILGGLPEEETHCAYLAGDTLQEALNDYMLKQKEERKRDNGG